MACKTYRELRDELNSLSESELDQDISWGYEYIGGGDSAFIWKTDEEEVWLPSLDSFTSVNEFTDDELDEMRRHPKFKSRPAGTVCLGVE